MGPATGSNGAAGSVIREEFERGGGGSYLSRSSRPSASEVGLNWREFGSARGRGVGVGRGRGRVAPCLYGPNWAAGDSAENGLMSPAAAACTEGGEWAWAGGGAEWRRAFIGLSWAGPRQCKIGLLSLAATTCSVGRDGDAIFSPTSKAGGREERLK